MNKLKSNDQVLYVVDGTVKPLNSGHTCSPNFVIIQRGTIFKFIKGKSFKGQTCTTYVKFNNSVIICILICTYIVSEKMFKKRHGFYRYNSILWGKIGQFGLITAISVQFT